MSHFSQHKFIADVHIIEIYVPWIKRGIPILFLPSLYHLSNSVFEFTESCDMVIFKLLEDLDSRSNSPFFTYLKVPVKGSIFRQLLHGINFCKKSGSACLDSEFVILNYS